METIVTLLSDRRDALRPPQDLQFPEVLDLDSLRNMSEPTPAEIAYYEQHASDNKGPNIIVACGICLFLPVFTVMLRIIARRRAGAALGIDDYCIMLAIVSQTTLTLWLLYWAQARIYTHLIVARAIWVLHQHHPRRQVWPG